MIQSLEFKTQNSKLGFTLIEVLVASFLISIVFLGIFGGFQLAIRTVSQSRAQMGAVYLSNQRIEELRNLPFSEIRTGENFITLNDVVYNIQTLIERYDDCADGTIEGFDCEGLVALVDTSPDDYKRATVRVSWTESWGGEIILMTVVAAEGLRTGEGKGALRIALSDSLGQPVEVKIGDQLPPCPADAIHITNYELGLNQCYGTDLNNPGVRLLILDASRTPNDYRIIIQKQGYAKTRTFKPGEKWNDLIIATPLRRNPTIREGEVYPITFVIDRTSDLTIRTLLPWGGGNFFDTFLNQENISKINNLIVSDKEVKLAMSSPLNYFDSGYLVSSPVSPEAMTEWRQLTWSDFEGLGTDIKYRLFYTTNTEWYLVPDKDLLGNSLGFDSSPVDLSGLDPSQFPRLKIRADFLTNDLEKTPILYEWELSWKDGQATPISNVNFSLRGDKIVGTDMEEQPIYKYLGNHSTDWQGEKLLSDMRADSYHFFDFKKGGQLLSLNQELSPMPFSLLPGEKASFALYLESENSLLVKVRDFLTGKPVFGATVRLSHGLLGYSEIQSTNIQGEAFFIPLEAALGYELNIQAINCYEKNYSINISGNVYKSLSIERYE